MPARWLHGVRRGIARPRLHRTPPSCRFAAPPGTSFEPAPRSDALFLRRHAENLERAHQGGIGLLFLGDSLTQGFQRAPEVWSTRFAALAPANFGISGDRIQHLAWRAGEGGELDAIAPRRVVLLIGTNNLPTREPAALAAGIHATAALVRCKLPQARVLLLGLLPRADTTLGNGRVIPQARFAADIAAVNAELARRSGGARDRAAALRRHRRAVPARRRLGRSALAAARRPAPERGRLRGAGRYDPADACDRMLLD